MGINFAGGQWVALGRGAAEWRARDESRLVVDRLFWAAVSRMNAAGHAAFGPGELEALLGTGGRPAGVSTLQRSVSRAIGRGDLMASSHLGCLVVPTTDVQLGGRARPCRRHGETRGRPRVTAGR